MAIVKPKNSKNYHVVIYEGGKHRWISTGSDDELEAKAMEIELLKSVRAAKLSARKERVREFIERAAGVGMDWGMPLETAWLAYSKLPKTQERTARTLASKRSIWRGFLEWLKENRPALKRLDQIDRDTAHAYMKAFEGKSASRFNNVKTCLGSVFNALKYEANLRENPFETVAGKTDDSESWRPFTDTECETIIKAAKGEWKLACLISLYTGLRFADVAHLEASQVDFTEGLISVLPRKLARYGNKLRIPIHPRLLKALKKAPKQGFLMPSLAVAHDRQDKSMTTHFGGLLKQCGISGNVSFHSFRHTFNTRLERAGTDIGTRKKLTGHSTDDMNLLYSHDIESMRRAIDGLE